MINLCGTIVTLIVVIRSRTWQRRKQFFNVTLICYAAMPNSHIISFCKICIRWYVSDSSGWCLVHLFIYQKKQVIAERSLREIWHCNRTDIAKIIPFRQNNSFKMNHALNVLCCVVAAKLLENASTDATYFLKQLTRWTIDSAANYVLKYSSSFRQQRRLLLVIHCWVIELQSHSIRMADLRCISTTLFAINGNFQLTASPRGITASRRIVGWTFDKAVTGTPDVSLGVLASGSHDKFLPLWCRWLIWFCSGAICEDVAKIIIYAGPGTASQPAVHSQTGGVKTASSQRMEFVSRFVESQWCRCRLCKLSPAPRKR